MEYQRDGYDYWLHDNTEELLSIQPCDKFKAVMLHGNRLKLEPIHALGMGKVRRYCMRRPTPKKFQEAADWTNWRQPQEGTDIVALHLGRDGKWIVISDSSLYLGMIENGGDPLKLAAAVLDDERLKKVRKAMRDEARRQTKAKA